MANLNERHPKPIDRILYARLLSEAVSKLGDEHALAVYLDLPEKIITNWTSGHGSPPDSVFLRVLDLLERDRDDTPPPGGAGD